MCAVCAWYMHAQSLCSPLHTFHTKFKSLDCSSFSVQLCIFLCLRYDIPTQPTHHTHTTSNTHYIAFMLNACNVYVSSPSYPQVTVTSTKLPPHGTTKNRNKLIKVVTQLQWSINHAWSPHSRMWDYVCSAVDIL